MTDTTLFDIFAFKLCQAGLYETVKILKDEAIEGDMLNMLTEDMLFKIGIKPLGTRLRVLKIISYLPTEIKTEVEEIMERIDQHPTTSSRDTTEQESDHSGNTEEPRNDMRLEICNSLSALTSGGIETLSMSLDTLHNQHRLDASTSQSGTRKRTLDDQFNYLSSGTPPYVLPSPLPYPSFSKGVLKVEMEGSILSVRSHIIRESAVFYLSLIPNISKYYSPICERLIERFPELQDQVGIPGSKNRFMRLKHDLAQCVRNQRRPGKKFSRHSQAGNSSRSFRNASIRQTLGDFSESNLSKSETRSLLTEQLGTFKTWMRENQPTVEEVLKKYKMFLCAEWIVYQAGLLLDMPHFMEYMEDSLWNLFKTVERVKMNVDDEESQTESYRIEILRFIEHQVGAEKSILSDDVNAGVENEGANFRINRSYDGSISRAQLMYGDTIILEAKDPSLFLLVTLWISVHYVFNLPFNESSKNFAKLIEHALLSGKSPADIYRLDATTPETEVKLEIKTFLSSLQTY